MAAIFVSLILITINTVAAQERQLNISQGSSLTPTTNSTWQSPSGLFAFGFYQQGTAGYAVGIFMAGVPQKTVVWAANRNQPPVPSNVTLLLTRDGRLVLTTPQGEETNIVESPEPASVASILDSGNFVLYNSAQQITWQSFENPTTTLLPGQRLLPGRELISSVSETDQSTGVFRLKMQQDGNLVQYPVNTTDTAGNSYWSTATVNTEDKRTLNLDEDGRLYLLNSTGFNIKTVIDGGYPTNETINLFKLDVDGILRLYSYKLNQNGNRSVVWTSTNNNYDAKGLCGPNGYCINNDQQAECKCLPGFVIVKAGDWISGCQRNFTPQDCRSNVGKNEYIINEVESTTWEVDSYSYLSLPTKEDCRAACLEYCICEAAIYKDGYCRKQKLPLRYGKRDLGDSSVALIKVGKLSSAEATPTDGEATPKGDAPREIEKEDQMNIIFIGVSLIVFAFIVLAIAGVLIYRDMLGHTKMCPGLATTD